MINSPFTLPCGVIVPNRLVKAATTERLSDPYFKPGKELIHLYERWSDTGAGLIITGNVMVDRTHCESAGNVALDDATNIEDLKKWTAAGTKNGNQLWTQLSHSGRQTSKFVKKRPKSASDVQLKKMGLFGKPVPLTEEEILEVISNFRIAAKNSKAAGFTGVQIHAAHGYLLNQFLSPITNKREDQWGGSIQNRSRLLKEIIVAVRQEVGDDFPISVKLNSADFQRGGFDEKDSLEVINMLEELGVDLLEISGGTYEKLAFFLLNEENAKESTKKREAYFLDFAQKVREFSKLPLLLTGGFRTYDFANECIQNGEIDFIGMARPFITNIDEIKGFLNGEVKELSNLIVRTGFKMFEDSAEGGFYARQLIRLAEGKDIHPNLSPMLCSTFLVTSEFKKAKAKKRVGSL